MKRYQTHGKGTFKLDQFKYLGENVIFESGVLVFHPENIEIGDNVYIGHQTILKGYYAGTLKIGSNSWIGQQCFFHSAGNLTIGKSVGIGPGVKIITSQHSTINNEEAIIHTPLDFSPVSIGDGCDIGVGTIILPGVTLGKRVLVGAGAVVTKSFEDDKVIVGVPAKETKN